MGRVNDAREGLVKEKNVDKSSSTKSCHSSKTLCRWFEYKGVAGYEPHRFSISHHHHSSLTVSKAKTPSRPSHLDKFSGCVYL